MRYSPLINLMSKSIGKASKGLVRDFYEADNLRYSVKGPGDFVTNADLRTEEILMEELSNAYPEYGILSEENGEIKTNSEYRWIIDPIDGTTNFIHGFPYFCIAIALEKTTNDKKEIIACVVEAPILGVTFWAEKGKGAWADTGSHSINRKNPIQEGRLRVSSRAKIDEAIITLGSLKHGGEQQSNIVQKIKTSLCSSRMLGSSILSLSLIATGKFDVFVQSHNNLWDIAAGVLLVKEAGGFVTDFNGKNNDHWYENGNIVAANSYIHPKIINMIA